jgi:F-box and WD-40 domain protein 1/11
MYYKEERPSRGRNSLALLQETENLAGDAHPEPRHRSISLSFPWRQRPKSSIFHYEEQGPRDLSLQKSRSHALSIGMGDVPGSSTSPQMRHEHQPHHIKGMFRRASVSLRSGVRGFVHRRTSVPAVIATHNRASEEHEHRHEHEPQYYYHHHNQQFLSLPQSLPTRGVHGGGARPKTSHSTWHRLRQAASFNRHSRHLHTGYGERAFELQPIESPTFPIPGSGEQPPIIPRNTGAAARQAAASACHHEFYMGNSGHFITNNAPVPKPNWLAAPEDGGLEDHESGIGIALTSSDMDVFVPSDEVDSDVDVGAEGPDEDGSVRSPVTPISKVDFVAILPVELSIQILALLDASGLATANRVSRRWREVVENQHIWRESFLREKTNSYATSGRVKPGAGLGVPAVTPSNDWREIYRVKEELDRRWKQGKARPVYLNGHSDSVYCLQFDE